MSARSVGLIATAMALLFASCATGISVTRVSSEKSTLHGAPWNLPMTQFTITITRHIVRCGATIEGAVEALPAAGVVIDPDQRYVLASNGWLATSDITSTLAPTGISTALNAQSVDATGAVISNIVGTVAQIFVGSASADVAEGAQPPPPIAELCLPDVATAVAELYPSAGPTLKAQVERDTAALAAATAKVSLLTAQTAADKSLAPKLVLALEEQASAQSILAADQRRLTADLHLTTDTQVVTWPHRAAEFRRETPYLLDKNILSKWTKHEIDSQSAANQFSVDVALYSRKPDDGSWILPSDPPLADVSIGVPVRLARTARLLICVSRPCPTNLSSDFRLDKTQTAGDFVVLQTGPMYVLPTTGGRFKSESASIALDQSGLPTTIQIAQKTSVAGGLSGAAKDTATQLAALPASMRSAQLAKTQAETNQLNANAALATAEAVAGLQSQTNTLAAQTALINAQSALAAAKQNAGLLQQGSGFAAQTSVLNAQAALATAQANAQIIEQTSVLASQASLINAQVAQLNAAAALVKAQATVP